MKNNVFSPGAAPVHLLAIVLTLSPVVRFSWDLWSQSFLHIALAAALFLFLVSRKPEFRFRPHGLFLIFLIGAILSLVHNPDTASIRNELWVLLDAVIAGFIFSTLPPAPRRTLFIIPVLVGFFFSVILIFTTLTSYHGGYLDPEAIVNPNVIAGYLTLAFPLSFVLWSTYGRSGWAVSAFLFAGILLTHSRVAILFSSVALVIYLWQRVGRFRRILAVAMPLLLLVLAYMTSLKIGQDSLGSRLLWWESAVKIFLANPVNGAGWGNFGSLFPLYKAGEGLSSLYAHNVFLQILSDGGMLAFIPFCGLLCIFLIPRGAQDPWTDRHLNLPLYLSAGSFLAVNLFDYSFFIPAVMLLFFAVLGASVSCRSAERKRPLVPAWGSLAIIIVTAIYFLIPLQASRYYRHGLYSLKHNDPAAAENALGKACRLDPLPYQYYSASAEAAFMRYAQSKDPAALQLAVVRQRQAIDRFPVGARLWADLSWLYLSAGDKERAIDAMRSAAARDLTTPRYRLALASIESAKTLTRHDQ